MGFIDPLKTPSPIEGITAQKELDADEWAIKTLKKKKSTLDFLNWIREKEIYRMQP